MRLFALGDIHLSHKFNRECFFNDLASYPDDGLILCGDVGEKADDLHIAFEVATKRFKHVFWVPGNHELYTIASSDNGSKGVQKYDECVAIARKYKVRTPEDPYLLWTGEGGPCIIALAFALYDYSFRPDHVAREDVLKWAEEEGIRATDESILFPDPFATRDEWCESLIGRMETKLAKAASSGVKLIIVNHWPLREDLITIPRIPRFTPWCGTKKTQDWHTTYNAKVVVTGHLHVRRTDWRDGVRFEECSLGYPAQWEDARKVGKDINGLLREILPGPTDAPADGTVWRRYG